MNQEQLTELLRIQQIQQTQISELLTIIQQQMVGQRGTLLTDDNRGNTSASKTNLINNFKYDKFNPETTTIEKFIDYFEQKCNILGQNHINIQKDLLITVLDPELYHDLKTALTPDFDTKTYEEIKFKLLDLHRTKKTRFKGLSDFWNSIRETSESMEHYANRLKELSRDCGYEGTLLERQLRDRFATGLNHQQLQIDMKQRWPDLQTVTEDGKLREVTFSEVFAVAQSREFAENDDNTEINVKRVHRHQHNMNTKQHKPTTARQLRENQCRRCGKHERHKFVDCQAKDHTCEECGTQGHFGSCCIKSGRAYFSYQNRNNYTKQRKQQTHRVKNVNYRSDMREQRETDESSEESGEDDNNVYKINKSTRCKKIDIHINGVKCTMDWDPGSIYSIITTEFWQKIGSPTLAKAPKLRAYCNFKLKPKGLAEVTVEVQGIQKILPVVVMKTTDSMLFGLDWSEIFNMEFPKPVYSIKTYTPTTLKQALNSYKELFNNNLGKVSNYYVNVHVKPNAEPKHIPARPIKFGLKKNIEIELDRLVKEGIITQIDPNVTPVEWATPTVNVLKTNGQIRICGDYRTTINPVLITHTHPVPLFDQLRQRLANGKKYTKIDLKDAYLQFQIAPESKKYLTISTHKGYFQYNRMPFGIATAPSIFQHYLETLLEGIPNVAVYFDDIALTGKNDKEHLQTLVAVFKKLQEAGLKVNLKKCTFLNDEIEYLGHIIDKNGVRPTKTKIDAISKATAPTNTKELRSFLGLVNFYERFIPHLHSICADLHALTGYRQRWQWTDHENKIFEETKQRIIKSRPLVAYDAKREIYLACDASEKGVGAVLYHKDKNSIEQPIAFASRKLKPAESKYSVIDREALAIFFGIKKFDQYLRGTKFYLVTDHKPLVHLLGSGRNLPKLVNNRLTRWALIIGSYDYHITYTKGENNIMADYLSRMPNPYETPTEVEETIRKITERTQSTRISDLTLSEDCIREQTKSDSILKQVSQHIATNWCNFKNENDLKPFYRKRDELSIEKKIIMWRGRVIIPNALQHTVMTYLHKGHPGISAMKALTRFYVWWPSIDEDIENFVKCCLKCQENRPNNPELPIYSWSIPDRVWERIHIDFAGPFEGKHWFVLSDALSKWIEVRPMHTTTSTNLCNELDDIFTTFGLPQIIVSDNGPQLTSEEFQLYCKRLGILHITSSPYHPRTNGLAERLVRTFKTRYSATKGDFKQRLREFLFSYRITPHNTTGKSPAQLMFGRQPLCVLDNIRPNYMRTLARQQLQTNIENAQKVPNFKEGDKVYIKTKVEKKWQPATVSCQTQKYSYIVRTPQGLEMRRHADHIRPRLEMNPETTSDSQAHSTSVQLHNSSETPASPQTLASPQTPASPQTFASPQTLASPQTPISPFTPANISATSQFTTPIETPTNHSQADNNRPRRSNRTIKRPHRLIEYI